MARQWSPFRRKFMERSIINPALSLLMKNLVIGQRQIAPNFSAFHWSPHCSLVSIGQHFATTSRAVWHNRQGTWLVSQGSWVRYPVWQHTFVSPSDFYAPNFEEVEEAYCFGPVRLSVTPFVGCKTGEPFELGTWNFICSISTKNKRSRIFFSVGPCMAKLCPFFDSALQTLSTR